MRYWAILVLASAALAEEPSSRESDIEDYLETVESPDVLVTGRQVARVPLEAPTARTVIGRDVTERPGVNTVADLLTRYAGFRNFDESGTDSKPNFTLRGLSPERGVRQAILVDGVPIEPAPYGHPGKSLFPFVLERAYAIDVHRGGYSVLYGPNTVAGVINFLTVPIPDKPMFSVRQLFGSHGESSTYVVAGGTSENVGVVVEAAYKSGDTHRDNGEFRIQSYGAKMNIDLTKKLTLLAQFDYYQDHSRLSDGLSEAAFQQDPYQTQNPFNYFDGYQTRGNFRLTYQVDDNQSVELLTYAYRGDREFVLQQAPQSGDSPAFLRHTPRPMTVWAVQPTYTAHGLWFGGKHEVKAGIRYHQEDIDTLRYDESIPFSTYTFNQNQHADYRVWSFFAQDEVRFGRFTVVPGLRWELIDIEGRNKLNGDSADLDFNELLPALSLSYRITDTLVAFGNAQSSFRPPSYSQIYSAAQGIHGERSENYELGLRSIAPEWGLNASATLFLINFHDQYETDPNDPDQLINIGRTRSTGVELEWGWHLGNVWSSLEGLRFRGAYSYIDAKIKSGANNGNQIPYVYPNQLSLTLQYDHSSGLWGACTANYTDESFSDPANTVPTSANGYLGRNPDYWLVGLRGGYRRPMLSERGLLELEIGSNNLFDTPDNYVHRNGKGLIKGIDRVFYGVVRFSLDF